MNPITRRSFVQAGTAGLALGKPSRPNVLLVTSDQESALLPANLNLPNRRRIEQRGVTFRNAFCNTPQCSPARAALLTGRRSIGAGTVTNIDPGSLGIPPSTALPSLGSLFKAAGYATGYFGKWHLGPQGPEAFGFSNAQIGFPQNSAAEADTPVTKMAAEWLRNQKGPWMAWVSLLNPHDIYYPPGGRYEAVAKRKDVRPPFSGPENLAGKPREQSTFFSHLPDRVGHPEDWITYRSYYCNMVEEADRDFGELLDAAGDLDSTVVVYTSDHGDALGEHGLPFKGPFMYEELIRIPLLIAGPRDRIGRGVRDEFAMQMDVLPTVASLAGLALPSGMDGSDLSRKSPGRDAVFVEFASQQQAASPIRTIRTKRWKLNWYDSGGKELYDLETDPHELKNLAGVPEVRTMQEQLEARLTAWRPSLTEMERQTPGRYLKPRAKPATQPKP